MTTKNPMTKNEMRSDLQEFVVVSDLVKASWESGDLAAAVNRLVEWSQVIREKYRLITDKDRVVITMPFAGLRCMQVCVLDGGISHEEILEFCNKHNPQLVARGWHTVVRSKAHARELGLDEVAEPGFCLEVPGRIHKIAVCL